MPLKGVGVAVLGGDARQVIVAKELHRQGVSVKTFGLFSKELNGIEQCRSLELLFQNVQALVLPMPGINEEGEVYTVFSKSPIMLSEAVMCLAQKGLIIYVGVAKPRLKGLSRNIGAKIVELAEIDELAILNSIPTAEGALKIAIEKTPFTIHGSPVFVLGFGRTGLTLARVVSSLGAKTTVAARNEQQLARAYEMGLATIHINDLPDYVSQAKIIFNTIPALVLTKNVLREVSRNCLIVDLASAPGGTDFNIAKKMGIEAILAPGLPGKAAPQTAGFMVARVVSRLLKEEVTNWSLQYGGACSES